MAYVVWIAWALMLTLCDFDLLHAIQRAGYRPREYFATLGFKTCAPPVLGTLVGTAAVVALRDTVGDWRWQLVGLAAAAAVVCACVWTRPHDPPLRPTRRCLRLTGAVFACNLLIAGAAAWGVWAARDYVAVAAFGIAAQVLVVPLAAALAKPLERALARRYERAARARLALVAPRVIGITGSYGKTSVKNFLRDLLSARYRVCASPENYNTPAGLCITVNRFLGDGDEILIAEMGARYRGDIAELCALFPPDAAVVTGIGTQHLATFGSAEALRDAKYEIVRGLKAKGPAFFGAGEGCRALYERGYPLAHSVDDPFDPYAVAFGDVRLGPDGSSFTLSTRETRLPVRTRLVGAQNLANLRLACMVARWLGLSAAELAERIARVAPVPHRLELLPPKAGVQVIDDSYNASAEGIAAAADVLALFAPVRAVITPGIVEAGSETYMVNYRAGSRLAGAADEIWFYGPNVRALADGSGAAGMRPERIHVAESRDAAVRETAKLPTPRVVMFCNDLPR